MEYSPLTFTLWGDEARARGYDLPEPFGIGVNYMDMRQNIDVDRIQFSGLGLVSGVQAADSIFRLGRLFNAFDDVVLFVTA